MPKSKKVRNGERFKCPYEGCKRSFAELWRLKVHYRAPPDVRGSGKERGHGQELAQCPLCGAHLMPGKHHIQCTGSRKQVQEGADDSKNSSRTAASVPKQAPAAAPQAEAWRPQPQAAAPPAPTRQGSFYGAEAWHAMQSQRSLAYGQQMPHAGHWQAMHQPQHQPQHHAPVSTSGCTNSVSTEHYWPAPGHSQLQPASSSHFGGHGAYPHVPGMHVPVQYTNTLTREAVPGKPHAAHVSLQTDLCGQTWPLSQPFPYPPCPFYAAQPLHGQAHFASVHAPGALPFGASSPHNVAPTATMSSHLADYHPRPGSPPYTLPEVVASASEPASNGELHPHAAAAATPVSPPSSPPPELLVDDLFDFDRLEASHDLALPTHTDDLQDIDAVLGMATLPGTSEDLFKMLTHDPVAGNPVLTTHIHQRDLPEGGFDFGGARHSADGAYGMGMHGQGQLVRGEGAQGQRFAGNCGQVAAMIKPDASDNSAALRM